MGDVVFWFRRDLRLGDHRGLRRAAELAGSAGVVPAFVVDEALLAPSGPTRAQYLAASLEALDDQLAGRLCLRAGAPAEALVELCAEVGASCVVATTDHAPYGRARDEEVGQALAARGVGFELVDSNYAVAPGTILNDVGSPFKVFTAFRRRWDALGPQAVPAAPEVDWREAPSTSSPTELVALAGTRRPALFGDLPDLASERLPEAGEPAALERLARFVEAGATAYKERRDVPGIEGTSRLSADLRFGALHPRTVLAAVAGADQGSTTFRSEIAWREFYADVLFHAPESVTTSLQVGLRSLRWDEGPEAEERFRTWARGETGVPMVDAAMRQLLATGWMHNRSRMLAASFLVKHLHLDWRWGARWFMWRLYDGDLASNTHGWQWTAGTGTDAAPFHRIFSPVAQAERFDADAAYVHRFVPELADVPPPEVFQPGGGSGLLRPAGYPEPMVDLKAERAEALERFAEARGKSTK
jgi:deoxyribodipyrimidine photo-lyase